MSTISNRFYCTVLEDGTTLHGNLVSDKSLSQSWNGSAASPNWASPTPPSSSNPAPFAEPTIWLTLLSGNTAVGSGSISNQKWYYNSVEIPFMSTTSTLYYYSDKDQTQTASITGYWSKAEDSDSDPDYRFFKYTETKNGVSTPVLRITSNFASSANVDMDEIKFSGSYVIDTAGVDFSSVAPIRITSVAPTSNIGVINFVNGISDITSPDQTITLYGALYDSSGEIASDFYTMWALNDGSYTRGGTYAGYSDAFQVTAAQVTDHAMVTCKFYNTGGTLLYTAYAAIDDMQDPEYMYIQYNGNNGNAAALRSGQTATFQVWVGTRDSAEVLGTTTGGQFTPTYGTIKVKLIDGEGITIGGSEDTTSPKRSGSYETSIPSCEGGDTGTGWRNLSNTMVGGKATITPHYNTVNGVGKKNLTGIVIAYTGTQSSSS